MEWNKCDWSPHLWPFGDFWSSVWRKLMEAHFSVNLTQMQIKRHLRSHMQINMYPNALVSLCTLLLFCQFCLLEAGRQHGWCTESDFEFMVPFHSERSVLLFQPNSQGGPQAWVRLEQQWEGCYRLGSFLLLACLLYTPGMFELPRLVERSMIRQQESEWRQLVVNVWNDTWTYGRGPSVMKYWQYCSCAMIYPVLKYLSLESWVSNIMNSK